MTEITIEIVKEHIAFVWADDSFSSYKPGLSAAEQKLRNYVGSAVVDSEDATIAKLIETIVVKDAFVIAAPTLAVIYNGKNFVAGDDQTTKPASPEEVHSLAKALRYQVRIAMDGLLLQLESSPIAGWETSQSYSLIPDGIIPNLTVLTSICKPPAIDDKYKWMEPTRMDFVREWKGQLVHHQYQLQKYFGADVITEMLKEANGNLGYELREVVIEMMWGDPAKGIWRRNDLMREMADNIETYEYITGTDVYTKYTAALENKRVNSSDSRIFVAR